MPFNNLRRVPLIPMPSRPTDIGWLWEGYLMPGDVTLLTSQWKTGKTTLVAGLLRAMADGGDFLDRPIRAGRAWVVSEESEVQWNDRLRTMPIGPHAEVLPRPFDGRPTIEEWNGLIDEAILARFDGKLDLLVVDPLASFLPGRCESDAGTLLEMLQPLHRLAIEGVAILLLHHPRKKPSEIGASARGSGALLGFVDIIIELQRFSRLASDFSRRMLHGSSRKRETPQRLAFEWNAATGLFKSLGDVTDAQFEDNWSQVMSILRERTSAATHQELLMDWPPNQERPSASSLYNWLNRATTEKRIRRVGHGTRNDPWRYRLENEDDEYLDRGELPPLRDLPFM